MDKRLLIGLVVGFGAFYLFEKTGKKKCSCNDAGTTEENMEAELLEPNPPNSNKEDLSCEEAVDIVMKELRMTSRMSEKAFQDRRNQELAQCKSMANSR